MGFPQTRMRRLRTNSTLRKMIAETHISVNDLVMPLFVCPGKNVQNPIPSMPGNYQFSIDMLTEEVKKIADLGIPAILLFGIPETKDEDGSVACRDDGIVQQATREIKKYVPDMYVIADVCNCEYTTHGHCGPVVDGDVHNDKTLEILGKQSVSLARAGVDMVAPSDMMDGRVGHIRKELDAAEYEYLPIMSYAAKYASAFYGPFRDAAGSAPQFGDRSSYQMDPSNSREAVREIALDIEEGADIVMVKPAMNYLDIVYRIKNEFKVPVAAYNVSGEFSMVKAAAEKGWISEERLITEIITSIKRAGADFVMTYHAKELANILKNK